MIQSNVVEAMNVKTEPVDREKICPFLLRMFCANGRHNKLTEYYRGSVPSHELQIYTWMDCSLYELMNLIKEVNPDVRRKGTVFQFNLVVSQPHSPEYRYRRLGCTEVGVRGMDDQRSLSQFNFIIGDYLDVSITTPHSFAANGGPGGGSVGRPFVSGANAGALPTGVGGNRRPFFSGGDSTGRNW